MTKPNKPVPAVKADMLELIGSDRNEARIVKPNTTQI